MSRRLGPRSPRSPMATAVPMTPQNQAASQIFDQFCAANTFQAITSSFHQMCDVLELNPTEHRIFYRQLKLRLTSWKAQSLWTKLDKRASHKEYKKGTVSGNARVLVIGCGPIGLRTAIEIAFCGGKVVLVEKRDRFSRNNVLHLWPFLIHDLKALGAKKFFGKFCAGSIDHISIRTLQCILLKVALLVGVEVHGGVGFVSVAEPHLEGIENFGWRIKVDPPEHPVSEYEFDVLVGADGKRNTLRGFKRKEFRGKLAIAITANFINRNTQLEARVEEISGVAYIFNQKFFKDLNQKTGIDLENIVYYKDETHYFVMTAKKHSLLSKQVLRKDYDDPAKLLSRDNVDQEELMNYAREAADVSTNNLLPRLDFAHNHYGQPDVAMFDFTSMFAAEHASRVIENSGKKLLVCLVGDSLLEPFWPTGSGCARGFLSALDSAWMVRNWASGRMTPLEVMAERESIYQLLSQTTPMNLNKNFSQYTIDPLTRYPNINKQFFKPFQVRHQYEGVDQKQLDEIVQISELKSKRYEWIRDSHYLLKWFQKQLESYKNLVKIHDLTASWRNGLALCALIHKYRPELIDVYSLDMNKVAENNQKAFDIAHKEFGIEPVMTGQKIAQCEVPDKILMTSYLSQFYEYFRRESIRPAKMAKTPEGLQIPRVSNLSGRKSPSGSSRLAVLNKISQRIRQRRQSKKESRLSTEEESNQDDDDMDKENESLKRHRKPGMSYSMARKKMKEEEESASARFVESYRKLEGIDPNKGSKYDMVKQEIKEAQVNAAIGVRGQNKVSELAKGLARQFSGGTPADLKKPAGKPTRPLIMGQAAPTETCYFCKDRVYLVEKHTAEGLCFHRGCLKCDYCGTGLRINGYSFKRTDEGEAKFYCIQHHGMRRQFVRQRKRSFGDKELLQKILPVISPEKAPVAGPSATPSTPSDSRLLKPPVSPITPPDHIDGDKNKTPERIEFEPESEYEESELEQTTHNLSSTLLDLSDEDQESDSDSEDEECDWIDEEELSDGDISWADLARNYSKQMKKKLKREARLAGQYDDSDSDTPTIGASDADYETDTETEDIQEERMNRRGKRANIPRLTLSPAKDYTPGSSPQKDAKSPASEEIQQKRLSFFSTVSEPVRIDPWEFLGISKKKAAEVLQEIETKKEELQENPENSSDEVQDIIDEEILDVISLSEGELEEIEEELQASVNAEYSRLLCGNINDIEADNQAEVEQQDIEELSESPQSDDDFDMNEEELQQRRVERKQRMHRSDEVVSGVAIVKQLDVPMVSIEDGGSSDATSLMEEVISPDKDKRVLSLSNSSLPNEMESILEEMASLPQEMAYDEPLHIDKDKVEDSKTISVHTTEALSNINVAEKKSTNSMEAQSEEEWLMHSLVKQSCDSINSTEKQLTDKTSVTDSDNSSQKENNSVQVNQNIMEKQSENVQAELSQNKYAFFSSPSQPVRIDAKSFLGLKTDSQKIDSNETDIPHTENSDVQLSEIVKSNDGKENPSHCQLLEASGDGKSDHSSIEEENLIGDIADKVVVEVEGENEVVEISNESNDNGIKANIIKSSLESDHSSESEMNIDTVDDLMKCGVIEELPMINVAENNDPLDDTKILVEENLDQIDSTNLELSDIVELNTTQATDTSVITELKITGLDSENDTLIEDSLLKCGLIEYLPSKQELDQIESEESILENTEILVDQNLIESEASDTQCDNLSDLVERNLQRFSSDDTILQDETTEELKVTGLDPDVELHTEDDLLKCGLIKDLTTREGLDKTEMEEESNVLESTELLLAENLRCLDDTGNQTLSEIIKDNLEKLNNDTLCESNEALTLTNKNEDNTDVKDEYITEVKHYTKTEKPKLESSSDESDTKFDTIKRRKGVNKTTKINVNGATEKRIVEQTSEGKNKMETNGENVCQTFSGSSNNEVKMSTSFYSEGDASRVSSILDSAPLANMDLEMEITSGTDTDYEYPEPTKPTLVPYVDIEDAIKTQDKLLQSGSLPENEENKSDETLLNDNNFDTQTKTKSEIEKEAIKRIDDMLLSLDETKGTTSDVSVEQIATSDLQKANTITKWLQDTNASMISPINNTECETKQDSFSASYLKFNHEDSSLPYVSFTNEDSSHFDSFGTPNEGFIASPAKFTGAFDETPKKGDNNETPMKGDISLIDTPIKIFSSDKNKINSLGQDVVNNSSSTLEKVCEIVDGNNLNDSSIIEFKVSDDEGEKSFCVDEKFIVTRDSRKKKKLKTSHSESSDFTLSTPSESLEFTSSVPELQSTHPSSLAMTASTTGDSFSAEKNVISVINNEDNLSFSDIAISYERESSISLEKLLNNDGNSAKKLSTLDNNLEMTIEQNTKSLENSKQEKDSTRSTSESPARDFNTDNISKSAPASVHPVKKFTVSQKTASSRHVDKDISISNITSPSNISIGNSSVSSIKEDSSLYYTPNVSEVEPMDTSEEKNETPKSPAPTVKSDSMLLDDRRNQIRKLDNDIDPNQSPVNSNMIDAKRKFFCETPKPVRIDHFKLFERDSKMKGGGSPEGKTFQKGWKSLDSPTTTNITAAIPSSNLASGDAEGMFYTPSTSVKNKPHEENNEEAFKKPKDVRKKLITDETPTNKSGISVARELSSGERKKIMDEKRDHARNVARERARLMSDEELGIKSFTPKSVHSKKTSANSESEKCSSSSMNQGAIARPVSAKSYFSQTSKESTGGSEPSPSSERKDKDKGKGLRVFKSQKSSPKMDKKLKKKKDDDEKENKDSEALKKEKKKSILSMLRPSKSHEKKDKAKGSPISPPLGSGDERLPSKEFDKSETKKHHGVLFRNKKAKSVEKQTPVEDPQAKRESLYKELAPMFEQVLGGPDGKSVSAVKAKIEHVAPPPAKAPHTVLEPPKAAVEEFDTESELGDTASIRSFQGSSTVSGLSEEELAKLIKKQQKAAKKRQREQELRRLHMAQEIQRQLEEVEVKQREIEQKGVIIERALRGEGPDANRDESELMQDWFNIVHEKNVLVRYESELMVHARELELEDRHARLEQQLRDRMSIDEDDIVSAGGGTWYRSPQQRMEEEQRLLQELVAVVEQRDALVALLEEDRQREREQEQGLKAIMSAKGFQLSPITYANRMRLPSLSDVHGTKS